MIRNAFLIIILLIFSLFISACSTTTPPSEKKAGMCNTLRSRLVFNGSTSNIREAEIQQSQEPLEQHNYDKDDCDQG